MNIYVGNLSTSANEEDLSKLFSEFGKISAVRIIKDMYTGVSKGFGFVELTGKSEEAISKLNGRDVKGKNIVVNEARPKKSNGSGRDKRFNSFSSRSGRY